MIALTMSNARVVLEHRHHEAAVELHGVAGEAVDLAQRGGAEAEVVDPRRHRVLVEEPAEHPPGGLRVVHHRALGDLQAQPARVQPRLVERVDDQPDEAGVRELAAGDVDRDRELLAARVRAPDGELRGTPARARSARAA